MLKIARKIVLTTALAAACGGVSAVQITIVDTVDPSPNLMITKDTPYVFTHDISNAFNVGFDTIASAMLYIHLIDEEHKGNEDFVFTIGGDSGSTPQTFSSQNLNNGSQGAWYEITIGTALQDLIADGKLSVKLTALSGDYQFADSTLTAEVARGVATAPSPASPASVPEPGNLLLVGAGLVGLGMTGRKKLQQRKRR